MAGRALRLLCLFALLGAVAGLGVPLRAEVEGARSPAASPAEAFRAWLPLALRGDAAAQLELGQAYAEAAAVPEDYGEAAYWIRRAAEQGHARAQHDLGLLYRKGLGVPRDYLEAYVWFELAAGRFGHGLRHEQARELRDMMAAFLTPAQRREAERLAAARRAAGQ